MRIVADNTPAQVAWDAFDRAALELHALYAVDPNHADTFEARVARLEAAALTVRLWDRWRTIFLEESGG